MTTSTEIAGGFDLSLSEEQLLVQKTAREFARDKVLPKAAEIDENKKIPSELIAQMGTLGFMGIDVPEEFGGSGLDRLTYMLVVEEINRACASTGVVLCTHVSLAIEPLLRFGTDAQKKRWLPAMAAGEKIGCFALSEPASGSDAAAMRTSARRDGDAFILNGTKNFITNGSIADVAIVFAQTDPALKHKGHRGVRRREGHAWVQRRKARAQARYPRLGYGPAIFQDCRVPAANLLGSVGDGFKIALTTLDGGRISIAAQAVGIARACLEDALAYAKEREAFGKKITDFQAIQWKLADMATRDRRGAPAHVEGRDAQGPRRSRTRSRRPRRSSSRATLRVKAARECVQIFGGYGYLADFPAERHYRDAKITEIYEGTSEIMKLVIASEILGQ